MNWVGTAAGPPTTGKSMYPTKADGATVIIRAVAVGAVRGTYTGGLLVGREEGRGEREGEGAGNGVGRRDDWHQH